MQNVNAQFLQSINGKQPDDSKKTVEIMLDVVRGEDMAGGKAFLERLPLGSDCLATTREKMCG
jgi:hypothetical protein